LVLAFFAFFFLAIACLTVVVDDSSVFCLLPKSSFFAVKLEQFAIRSLGSTKAVVNPNHLFPTRISEVTDGLSFPFVESFS